MESFNVIELLADEMKALLSDYVIDGNNRHLATLKEINKPVKRVERYSKRS